jgi:hypothetical protein
LEELVGEMVPFLRIFLPFFGSGQTGRKSDKRQIGESEMVEIVGKRLFKLKVEIYDGRGNSLINPPQMYKCTHVN